MSIAMTQAEKEDFLAGLHVGIISLVQTGRSPLTIPIWYAYEPGKEICFVTGSASRKGKLLALGSQVSLCVQEEQMPYKYVSVEGVVTAIAPAEVERDIRPLARRYYGSDGGDRYIGRVYGSGSAAGDLLIRVRPQHWLAADYSRL